jgi:hypothetical protein
MQTKNKTVPGMPAGFYRVEAIVFMARDLKTGKANTNYIILLSSAGNLRLVRSSPKEGWIVMPKHEVPEQHWVFDDENRDNAIDAELEDIAEEILVSQADHALSSGDDSEEEPGADNNGEGQREGTATPDKQQKRYRGADGLARTAGGVEWEMELETEERRQASVEERPREGDQQLDKTAELQQLHELGTEAYPNSPIQKDGRANHQSRESDIDQSRRARNGAMRVSKSGYKRETSNSTKPQS